MTISALHKESFNTRLKVSDLYTKILVKYLEKIGHFSKVRQSTLEDDLQGVDWWVTYPGEDKESPIQFKLRDRRKDCPVCRYQPLYGLDHEKNVEGRDYRGLRDKVSKNYYVAFRGEDKRFISMYRMSSDKLNKLVVDLDEEWTKADNYTTTKVKDVFGGTYNKAFFTSKNVQDWVHHRVTNKLVFRGSNGCEIWWKKNRNEGNPKLNMYIPEKLREETFCLSDKTSEFVESCFVEMQKKGNYETGNFIE